MTVFDIETKPQSDAQLELVKPVFRAPSNYKDQAKIDIYILDAEAEWKKRAALSALTGRVLAIGTKEGAYIQIIEGAEPDMLAKFWQEFQEAEEMAGFCVKSFDLPFLVQRSFINQVKVPVTLFDGRYYSRDVVDLQEVWLCYGRERDGASLDAVCRACGIGGKTGSGADFARLYETDREAALMYLRDDLNLTQKLAERLL